MLLLLYLHWLASHQQATKAPPPPAISVVAARAHRGSIAINVNGLGTVVPIYTVTVTSRIDGELMDVLYREGQLAHKGDLLVDIDARPYETQLTQFQGALVRDQALLANARIDLARYAALLPQHAIPEQTYATQVSLVKQYEGDVTSDQGQIASAKLNIFYCRITAPITGRVGLRLVDPGNIVSANVTPLVVITQIDPITVVFTIGEQQIPEVRRRMAAGATLPVAAFDEAFTTKLAEGRLETIDNQIDPTTGTVRLRAIFNNPREALFPNQFVNARLQLKELRNVTLVPNAAIQRNGTETYVWLVQPDETVVNRKVEVGATGPSESEILSGVSPGDVVVTEGVDRLHAGAKVNAEIPKGSK